MEGIYEDVHWIDLSKSQQQDFTKIFLSESFRSNSNLRSTLIANFNK